MIKSIYHVLVYLTLESIIISWSLYY